MTKPSAKSYLLDIGEWQHFTDDILPEWINNHDHYDGAIAATTIDDNLIKPLSAFLEKEDKKVPNSTLVTKGIELLNYLELDIASKFRNGQTVVGEQLETLNELVNEFLAIFGSGEFAKKSKPQSKIAKKDRVKNKPTKERLLELKTRWVIENGQEYGWKKDAKDKTGISRSTLQRILSKS